MKLFIKENPNKDKIDYLTGTKIEVKNITEDYFDISIWFAQNIFGDKTIYEFQENPSVNAKINKNDIFFDTLSKSDLIEDHNVIVGYIRKFSDGSIKYINLFAHTKSVKGSIGYILSSLDIAPLFFIIIPFKDSPIKDWTFIASARELVIDGVNVSDEFNFDNGISASQGASKILPSISLIKNGNKIVAELSEKKGGVYIYFETTAGYLTKSRAITNENGIAETEVVGAEEGKVKAGFKYFSGKAEVEI